MEEEFIKTHKDKARHFLDMNGTIKAGGRYRSALQGSEPFA